MRGLFPLKSYVQIKVHSALDPALVEAPEGLLGGRKGEDAEVRGRARWCPTRPTGAAPLLCLVYVAGLACEFGWRKG